MRKLGEKITISITNQIGDYISDSEISPLNFGIIDNVKTYVIDSLKKEIVYTGYVVGIAYNNGKIVAYLISSRKNKIYSREYLKSKIDFLKVEYIANYLPNNHYKMPILKYDLDHFYYLVDGDECWRLSTAFEDVANIGFYYSYDSLINSSDGKNRCKDHSHSHDFESVISDVYNYPEAFEIKEDERIFYSEQEIKYLRALKSYLLACGLKNIDGDFNNLKRFKNSRIKEFSKYPLYDVNKLVKDKILKDGEAFDICFCKIIPKKNGLKKEILRNDGIVFAVVSSYNIICQENEIGNFIDINLDYYKKIYDIQKKDFLDYYKNEKQGTKYFAVIKKYKLLEKFDLDKYFKNVV